MRSALIAFYNKIISQYPVVTLAVVALFISFFAYYAPSFKLDASADSLVLENDQDLRYYRSMRARYGSDDYLVITYTPFSDLFSKTTLADLRKLRDSLLEIKRVESVTSILDVPLINSPAISLTELDEKVRKLDEPDTDVSLAKKEFTESPLYQNLILSPDGKTTALQVLFQRDNTYYTLLNKRDSLREKQFVTELTFDESTELDRVSGEFKKYSSALIDQESMDIAKVRAIMDQHRDQARLFLGGVPMITSDMIDFIQHDLVVFGLGVLCFLIVMLAIFFHRIRWVMLPMLCCFTAILFMFGYLGFVEWRVTVVSSNFTSLLLIITLSLTVHLIVRYHELHAQHPDSNQRELVLETMHSKAIPSFYTALTTIIAFSSLLVSGIRPVIDFGWMMAIGITMAFLLSFILFPASLMLLKPKLTLQHDDFTSRFTKFCANLVNNYGKHLAILFGIIIIGSAIGISNLTVENRFIDHFKSSTEIYQGMEVIDKELGGTTPLDIIVDADAEFYKSLLEEKTQLVLEDELYDDEDEQAGLSGTSFWYNEYQINKIDAIHTYLENLKESGKVISLATALKMMRQLNENKPLDNMLLSIIHKKMTLDIKKNLFDPYMSDDGNQLRFSVRVFESDASLRRNELLDKIRKHLTGSMRFADEQIHLSGMVVLYNNMLQSLYRSQVLTIGVVFLMIMVMFIILFRSLVYAVIAIIPNLMSAGMVLGLMGWLKIPLDIMTITIAAITIGIAVDDTIHYIHRFMEEIHKDYDYAATMKRCHASIGRAMYYTSITVIVGFSILALSNFMPTIYFGLLTGFAMFVALIANLTLLPLLLITVKPANNKRKLVPA